MNKLLTCIAFLLCSIAGMAQESNNGKQLWAASFLNKKAPELTVEQWLTTPPETKGKFVLIDFWASWCNPCRKEIPNLKNLYKLYGDKGFQIVSISIDKKKAEWEKALEEEQLPWPNFLDETGVADLYKVRFVPTMYLIDAQGTLVGENLHGQALADKLKELFQ